MKYWLYGLLVESDEPIDELEAVSVVEGSAAPAEIRIVKRPEAGLELENAVVLPASGRLSEDNWPSISRTPEGYRLSFASDATFWVTASGREIHWFECTAPRATQVHLLLDHVVPRALSLLGLHPLHATAVAMSGRAIAFLANTGAGKSTLAAKLVSEGCKLVTDDCLVLSYSDAEPVVLAAPGYVGLRLYDDARTAVCSKAAVGHMAHYTDKKRVSGFFDLARASVPLSAIYLLERLEGVAGAEAVVCEPMTRAEAVMALTSQSFRMDASLRHLLTGQLRFCSQVAGRVPIKRCKVPSDLSRLGDVAGSVLDDAWARSDVGVT